MIKKAIAVCFAVLLGLLFLADKPAAAAHAYKLSSFTGQDDGERLGSAGVFIAEAIRVQPVNGHNGAELTARISDWCKKHGPARSSSNQFQLTYFGLRHLHQIYRRTTSVLPPLYLSNRVFRI
jgi:hypothetical protein